MSLTLKESAQVGAILVGIFFARVGAEAAWNWIFPSCWRCGYEAGRVTYEQNHNEAICEASKDWPDDILVTAVEKSQPCAIYYESRWRIIRPYLFGKARRTGNWLVRAIELSSNYDRSPVGYRTYNVGLIKRAAALPYEEPYMFESKCYGEDNVIGEPCATPIRPLDSFPVQKR